MNKFYRLIWNATLNAWVVASEFAKSHRKGGSSSRGARVASAAAAVVLAIAGGDAGAYMVDPSDPTNLANVGTAATDGGQKNNTAFGSGARAIDTSPSGGSSTAIGYNTTASGAGTTAVGVSATASGGYSTAVGLNVTASGQYETVVGTQLAATGDRSVTIGSGSTNSGFGSVLIGYQSGIDNLSDNSIAMGNGATVTQSTYGVAIGYASSASNGTGATAVGDSAAASGTGATAYGYKAKAYVDGDTAVGNGASANGGSAVAVGNVANASGNLALALGGGSSANKANATAVGPYSKAFGIQSTAVGREALANGDASVAMGYQATAQTGGSIAIGRATGQATTAGYFDQITIGTFSYAGGNRAVALGYGAKVVDGVDDGVAIGSKSVASTPYGVAGYAPAGATAAQQAAIQATKGSLGALSVGDTYNATKQYRQITGVAAGTADSDAVNVAQLKALPTTHYYSVNDNGTAGGNYNNDGATGASAMAAGVGATASGAWSTAFGSGAQASGAGTVVIGSGVASYKNTIAIGSNAQALGGDGTVVIGNKANANSPGWDAGGMVAIGNQAIVNNTNGGGTAGVAIGSAAKAVSTLRQGGSPTAIGTLADATGAGSQVAIGDNAAANGSDAIAIGGHANANGVRVSGDQSTGIGQSVSVSGSTSTAVGYNNSISGNASGAFGSSNAVAGSGYAIGNGNNIGSANAFVVGNNVTIASGLDGAVVLGNNSTASAATATPSGTINGQTYTYAGGNPSAGDILSVGSNAKPRQLQNLAAGQITASSTDAVNGSQLFATNSAINSLANTPLNFTGNDATAGTVSRKLGDTLNIAGGATTGGSYSDSNLKTVTDPATGTIHLQMAESPKFGNVTINASGSGKITGVTAGTAGSDAVNVSQLQAAQTHYYSVNDNGTVGGNYNNDGATGVNALAAGVGAASSGRSGVAVGEASKASNTDAIAMGHNATAASANSAHSDMIAIGLSAKATNDHALAVGTSAVAQNANSAAVGANATASGDAASAFGHNATASGSSSTALGLNANASKGSAVALGNGSSAAGDNSAAIGYQAATSAINSLAIGNSAKAQTGAFNSIAIGSGAVASTGAINGVALGNNATASINDGIALGSGSVANTAAGVAGYDPLTKLASTNTSATWKSTLGAVSVGDTANGKTRQINGLAAGTQATDAVNVAQLSAVSDQAVKYDTNGDGTVNYNSVTLGGDTYTSSTKTGGTRIKNVAAGVDGGDAVNVDQLTEMGDGLTAKGLDFAGNEGSNVHRDLGTTLAITGEASTTGDYSGANLKTVTDPLSGAISLQMAESPKFGNVTVNADGSGKITGVTAGTDATDAVNVSQLGAATADAVMYDNSTHNTVTLGGTTYDSSTKTGGTRIKNVAAGVDGGDAVNVDQLTGMGDSLTAKGLDFAGNEGSNVHRDLGTTLAITGEASTSGSYSGANLKTVTDPLTGAIQLQMAESPKFGNVTVNADGSGKITGVTAGTDATDAVNVSQLGAATADSVMYDNSTHNTVTLGGTTYDSSTKTGGTRIKNVAAGVDGGDAVNVDQLTGMGDGLTAKGLDFAGNEGSNVHRDLGTTLAITGEASTSGSYSGANLKTVTDPLTGAISLQMAESPKFGNVTVNADGSGKITGVTAGTDATDAVNVSQLGAATADAVMYDNSTHNSVTLGGDTYISSTKTGGTRIKNVAAGVDGGDAVNVDQLTGMGDGLTAKGLDFAGNEGSNVHRDLGTTLAITGEASTSGSYSGANLKTVTDPLTGAISLQMAESPKFGNVTVNADGSGKITGVTAGTDATDAVNVSQLGAATADSVMYDNSTHNTVTLGGTTYDSSTKTGGTRIKNVAAGVDGGDAVNVDQLTEMGDGLTAKGLDFAGNEGSNVHRDLGTTLAITGEASTTGDYSGANLKTVTDPLTGAISLQMAESPKFGNVTVNADGSGKITGVTAGTDATDAVNVSQLGAATADAVMYDNSTHNTVTLGGTTYDSSTKTGGTRIKNVAAGVDGGDAVNVDQLTGMGDSLTAKGLDFAGNEGSNVHRDLGTTLAITGEASTSGSYSGANLKTVTDPLTGAIQLQMAESPKFGNVTVNADGSGKITGVTAGTDATDAVNVSQLGAATADSVMYDNSTHNTVTLGGTTYDSSTKTGGTRIKNVAAGVDGGDAVNVDQLTGMGDGLTAKGLDFAGNEGSNVHRDLGTTLAITGEASTTGDYSGANLKTVTDPLTGAISLQMAESPKFGNVTVNADGSGKITGVTAGTDATDAVNVSQLGAATADAVMYDNSTHNTVTLGGTTYDSSTKTGGTRIKNVAAGVDGGDAVNVDQLTGMGDSLTAKGLDFAGNEGSNVHRDLGTTLAITGEASTSGSYSGANLKTVTDPLTGAISLQMAESPKFGNVTVNADGSGKITGVTAGTDATDAVNVSQLGAATADAVMYDNSTHNTVTLGGTTYDSSTKTGGTRIKNVAAGVDGGDAVNVDQLTGMGDSLTAKGLDFAGNEGSNVHRDLGTTLAITGEASTSGSYSGANLKTVTDPLTGAIQLQMAESPKFGNVTVNADGSGKITGVTAGTDATDAVNVSQLGAATADAVMYDNSTHNTVTLGGDIYSSSSKTGGTKITNVARGVDDSDAVNMSQLNETNVNVTNLGDTITHIAGDTSTTYTDVHGVGIRYVRTNEAGLMASDSSAEGQGSTAVGYNATSIGESSLALGREAQANNTGDVALGAGSVTDAAVGTAGVTIAGTHYDFAGTSPTSTVSVGSVGNERTLTNVAAGRLSATSTDAVNGSQLFATNSAIDGLSNNIDTLDQNAVKYDLNGDGTVNYNSVTLGGDTYISSTKTGGTRIKNVAAGVDGGDAVNVDQLTEMGDGLTAKGLDFAGNEGSNVHRDLGTTLAITGTASTAGDYSGANLKTVTDPLTGTIQLQMAESPKFGNVTINAGGSGKITGVTAGTDGTDGTDAVNVDQLTAVSDQTVKYDTNGDGTVNYNSVTLGGDTYNSSTKTGGTRIKNVAAGVDGGDAVNVDQLTEMGDGLTAKGLDFAGNEGSNVHRDLGTTLAITGEASTAGDYSGANLKTVTDPLTGTIQLQMAESPKFGNVTVNADGSGKITGVTAGTDATDAVNVGQLKDVKDLASAGWNVSDADGHSANIGPNGKVTFKGDSNIGVAQNGTDQDGQIAVTLSRHLDVDSVTAGDTVIDSAGLTINNGPSVTVNGISAGGKKITNVANGEVSETSTDAVNGSQLFALGSQLTNIDGRVTNIEGSVTNINNGGGIKYFHANSIKDDSLAAGANSVAAGPAAVASGASSVAMGDEAKATADQATAVGANATASGTGASAFGNNATAEGNGSLAMGDGAKATKEKSSAIGSGAQATATNAVALGADSIADREDSVSVGSEGNERQITNVKAGVEDTDAVNVSQLKGVSGAVSNLDNRVTQVDNRVTKVEGDVSNIQNGTDGMFQVNNTSNLPKPKPTGQDSVAGGAGAEASGANSVAIGTKSKAAGENSVAMGNGASASAKNSVAVGANSVADRDNSVSVGSVGNERQITNLAAGRADTDAVNVGQLTKSLADVTNNANSYTDSRYSQLKNDLNKQDDVLSAGIAGALAQASLPQPYAPGASMASAGLGNYRGQSSVAVGVSRISDNGKWVTKLQGNADTQGEVGVSVGVGYQW